LEKSERLLTVFPANLELLEMQNETKEKMKLLQSAKAKDILSKTHFKSQVIDTPTLTTAKKLQTQSTESRYIESIVDENEIEVTNIENILKVIRNKYLDLFTSVETNIESKNKFVNSLQKTLSPFEKDSMEIFFTEKEICDAIRSFENGKTPGSDGLNIEFYKNYLDKIVPIMHKLYIECFTSNQLSSSMYFGIISQLYKGKGPKNRRENWRPLTMLNCDYKILAKVICNRLSKTMTSIVDVDQTCAVPGRSIQDGILFMHMLSEKIKSDNLDGLILSIDQMSAFDLIEHDFIFSVFEKLGFGPRIMRWMRIIYDKAKMKSCVQVNGVLSAEFGIERGIRQGCPLSALIYVIVSEAILTYVKNDRSVKGVLALGQEYKLCAYADDTNIFLSDFKSVDKIFAIYDEYTKASGAILKKQKTKILTLGELRKVRVPDRLHGFLVEQLEVFGVKIMHDGMNFEANYAHFREIIKQFSRKVAPLYTSIFGKIHIFNTYLLSNLWYKALILNLNNENIKEIEKTLQNYINFPWTRNFLPLKTLKSAKNVGGVAFPDIKLKLECFKLLVLLKRKSATENLRWHLLFDHFLDIVQSVPNPCRLVPSLISVISETVKRRNIYVEREVVRISDRIYLTNSFTASKLYSLFSTLDFPKTEKPMNFWGDQFGNVNWISTWQIARTKFSDGFSRNVHYQLLHNAHWTNEKLSKFQRIENTCRTCDLTTNVKHVETVKHTFVTCPTATRVYDFLAIYFRRIGVDKYDQKNLIFGITLQDKRKTDLFNFLVILSHRCIWQIRNKVKKFGRILHVENFFLKILKTSVEKLYLSFDKHVFVRHFAGRNGLVTISGNEIVW
jgi:hypothetical protein